MTILQYFFKPQSLRMIVCIKLKAGRLCLQEYLHNPHRNTDKFFGLVSHFWLPTQTRMDRRMDTHYQMHYLPAMRCFAIDNNENIIHKNNFILNITIVL